MSRADNWETPKKTRPKCDVLFGWLVDLDLTTFETVFQVKSPRFPMNTERKGRLKTSVNNPVRQPAASTSGPGPANVRISRTPPALSYPAESPGPTIPSIVRYRCRRWRLYYKF